MQNLPAVILKAKILLHKTCIKTIYIIHIAKSLGRKFRVEFHKETMIRGEGL